VVIASKFGRGGELKCPGVQRAAETEKTYCQRRKCGTCLGREYQKKRENYWGMTKRGENGFEALGPLNGKKGEPVRGKWVGWERGLVLEGGFIQKKKFKSVIESQS